MSFPVSYADDGTITAYINNTPYIIGPTHPGYGQAKKAWAADDADAFVKATDIPAAVQSYVGPASLGKAEFKNGTVYYNGEPIHDNLADRVLKCMSEGLPFDPLLRFLERLEANPSPHSRKELFNFLQHRHLPITTDGYFLGYKRVRPNWLDYHSSKFDNHIGQAPRIPRNLTDPDWRNACSNGFHVGTQEYVMNFYGGDPGSHVLLVKVDPVDVIGVPETGEKLRTCAYTVVDEYKGPLTRSVYGPNAEVLGDDCDDPDDNPTFDDEEE